MIFLYPFGVPLLLFFTLYRHRKGIGGLMRLVAKEEKDGHCKLSVGMLVSREAKDAKEDKRRAKMEEAEADAAAEASAAAAPAEAADDDDADETKTDEGERRTSTITNLFGGKQSDADAQPNIGAPPAADTADPDDEPPSPLSPNGASPLHHSKHILPSRSKPRPDELARTRRAARSPGRVPMKIEEPVPSSTAAPRSPRPNKAKPDASRRVQLPNTKPSRSSLFDRVKKSNSLQSLKSKGKKPLETYEKTSDADETVVNMAAKFEMYNPKRWWFFVFLLVVRLMQTSILIFFSKCAHLGFCVVAIARLIPRTLSHPSESHSTGRVRVAYFARVYQCTASVEALPTKIRCSGCTRRAMDRVFVVVRTSPFTRRSRQPGCHGRCERGKWFCVSYVICSSPCVTAWLHFAYAGTVLVLAALGAVGFTIHLVVYEVRRIRHQQRAERADEPPPEPELAAEDDDAPRPSHFSFFQISGFGGHPAHADGMQNPMHGLWHPNVQVQQGGRRHEWEQSAQQSSQSFPQQQTMRSSPPMDARLHRSIRSLMSRAQGPAATPRTSIL